MLTRLVTRFGRGVESAGGGFVCNGVEAKAMDHQDSVERQNISALSIGSEWNESQEASYLSSHHHLRRPNDKMRFPKFLRVQKFHRRTRSGPRSEIDSIEGQSEAGLAVPRPTESTPDFRTDTPTLLPPSPPIPHDQKSSSM